MLIFILPILIYDIEPSDSFHRVITHRVFDFKINFTSESYFLLITTFCPN